MPAVAVQTFENPIYANYQRTMNDGTNVSTRLAGLMLTAYAIWVLGAYIFVGQIWRFAEDSVTWSSIGTLLVMAGSLLPFIGLYLAWPLNERNGWHLLFVILAPFPLLVGLPIIIVGLSVK